MTSVMQTDLIKNAIKAHGVAVKTETPKEVVEDKIVDAEEYVCPHCHKKCRTPAGFRNHTYACILNPNRVIHTTRCEKCGVDIPNQGVKSHASVCTGDPTETIARKEYTEHLRKRKAIAILQGKKFVPRRGTYVGRDEVVVPQPQKAKAVKKVTKTTKASSNNEDVVESLVAVMLEHLGGKIVKKMDLFADWVWQTEQLLK